MALDDDLPLPLPSPGMLADVGWTMPNISDLASGLLPVPDSSPSTTPPPMISFEDSSLSDFYDTPVDPSAFASGGGVTDGLINGLIGSTTSLLGAFVIQPQQQRTAEKQAQAQANIAQQQLTTSAMLNTNLLSTILQWGLIGLIIFLVFGYLTKK